MIDLIKMLFHLPVLLLSSNGRRIILIDELQKLSNKEKDNFDVVLEKKLEERLERLL